MADDMTTLLMRLLEAEQALREGYGTDLQPSVAALHASGDEPSDWAAQSVWAPVVRRRPATSPVLAGKGPFEYVLVRATRQKAETRGLLAMAHGLADVKSGIIIITQHNNLGAKSIEGDISKAFSGYMVISKDKKRSMIIEAATANAAVL